MPNALTLGGMPPPPVPEAQAERTADAPLASAKAEAANGGPVTLPPPPPAPTHKQAVAALRHFHAIGGELRKLLADPDLGKTNARSQIIDAATKLVADRILTPAQAVQQLGAVPERPYDQRQWVEKLFEQTIAAEIAVIDHHSAGHQGSGDFAAEFATHGADTDADDHIGIMDGMMAAHYGGRGNV